jgi:hypothetical protein
MLTNASKNIFLNLKVFKYFTMKFGKYLIDTSVPEWKLMYIDYKSLKRTVSQEIFIQNLDNELKKIRHFYYNQINEFDSKWSFILSNKETNKKETKKLLRDFHQLNEFLENYQKLNKIGFVKIIKKFDKRNETNLSNEILNNYIENNVFTDSTCHEYLKKIIIETTEFFDNKKQAMYFLGRNNKPIKDEFTFFKSGMYIGLSIPIITLYIIKIFTDNLTSGIWYPILYIYAGMFILILSLFGFGIDVYIWRKFRIKTILYICKYIFIALVNKSNLDCLSSKSF